MEPSKPIFIRPLYLIPPHSVIRPEQVELLANQMREVGWQGDPLIAYFSRDGIQLLSGTHRQAAALKLDLMVPVVIYPFPVVHKAWGTPDWHKLMKGELETSCTY